MKIILIILFSSISLLAQIKPFTFGVGSSATDTTTNIYVNSVSGDDGNDGLTFATAKLTSPSAQSLVDAPTDTIFYYGTFDSLSFYVNATFSAYNLSDKPLVFGADTVDYSHGYAWGQFNTSGTTYDTNSVALADTETVGNYNQSYTLAFRVPITKHGYLYSYLVYFGGAPTAKSAKFALGTRSDDVLTVITDSCQLGATTITDYNALNTFTYGVNGRYLSEDTLWIVMAISSGIPVPYGSGGGGLNWMSEFTSGSYANFPQGSPLTMTQIYTRGNLGVGMVVQSVAGTEDTAKFYAVFPDTVYQVFISGVLGTNVSDASLVDTIPEWHYSNDTLYVNQYADTTTIEATTRDGITAETSGLTVNGFNVKKARYGIFANGSLDTLTFQRNFLKNNYYGLMDSSAGDALYSNNIFTKNFINFKIDSKDTAYIYNNDFYTESYSSTTATNIVTTLSKLNFRNNIIYTGIPKVGSIDLAANILSMDYNAYAYYNAVADKFWSVEGINYDSLAQYVAATSLETNSYDYQSWKEWGYQNITRTWVDRTNDDFSLVDTASGANPAIDNGVDIGLVKDYIGNPIPDALTSLEDMGAYEEVLSDQNPQAPTAIYAVMTGDSASITYAFSEPEDDLDSARIYSGGVWIASVPIGNGYYDHPAQSSTTSVPEVTQLEVASWTETTADINFYIKPNNLTTTYRVRYGIGSFTDTTTFTGNSTIFIPQSIIYGVRLIDTAGNIGSIKSANITDNLIDSILVQVQLTGLTNSSNYVVDISALNSAGWTNSEDKNFTTGGTISADFYITYNDVDDEDATNDTLTWSALKAGIPLVRGKSYAFEKGKTYEGSWTVVRDTCTVEGGRITVTTYGSGLKPIITTKTTLPSLSWSNLNGAVSVNGIPVRDTVWVAEFPSSGTITKGINLWLDGVEAFPGNALSYATEGAPAYSNQDGTWFVNSVHKFNSYESQKKLYIYVAGNQSPEDEYSTIEYNGGIGVTGLTDRFTLVLSQIDYMTFDGLDIQCGGEYSIGMSGADYITFENCNIGLGAPVGGIAGNSIYLLNVAKDTTCDYVTFSKDTIDSGHRYPYLLHQSNLPWFYAPYLIKIDGTRGANRYWTIDSCTIRSSEFGVLLLNSNTNNITISNNHFNGGGRDYMKPWQFNGADDIDVYNNYIDSCNTHWQLNPTNDGVYGVGDECDNVNIYYNIFVNVIKNFNVHDINSRNDWGEFPFAKNCNIFNNTIINYYYGVINTWYYDTGNKIYNNLFVETSKYNNGIGQFRVRLLANQEVKNNLFSSTYLLNSTGVFYSQETGLYYTKDEFNALGGTISGNLLHVGANNETIDVDYTVPLSSDAKNAGLDIDALLPDGFTDRQSNIVDQTTPNIGAIDN